MLFISKFLNCLSVPTGECLLGFGENARPVITGVQTARIVKRLPQQGLLRRRVGVGRGWPPLYGRLTIGCEQRHIDAVERGAGHQAERGERF